MKKLVLTSLCGVALVTTAFAQSPDNVEQAVRFRVKNVETQLTVPEKVSAVSEKLNVSQVGDYQSGAQLQELGSSYALAISGINHPQSYGFEIFAGNSPGHIFLMLYIVLVTHPDLPPAFGYIAQLDVSPRLP